MTTATPFQPPLPELTRQDRAIRHRLFEETARTLAEVRRDLERDEWRPLDLPGQTLEMHARSIRSLGRGEERLCRLLEAAAWAVCKLLAHLRQREYRDVYPVMNHIPDFRVESRGALDAARAELNRWKARWTGFDPETPSDDAESEAL